MSPIKTKSLATLITSIIAFINSIIVLVRFIADVSVSSNPSPLYIIIAFYTIIAILSAILLAKEVITLFQERKRFFKIHEKGKIKSYLVDFIEKAGRTVILSRDLSWVDASIQSRIEDKARKGDLIIFIPKENDISKKLLRHGADIRYFGELLNDPADSIIKSRFTIVQWDSNSARMTYPKQYHSTHYNFEYVLNDPTMDVSLDLVRLLIRLIPAQVKVKNDTNN